MPIEQPSDCDDFARCTADEQFQDMIQDLQEDINDAQENVNDLDEALFDAEAALAAAVAERNAWVRAAIGQVEQGAQRALDQMDQSMWITVGGWVAGGALGGLALGAASGPGVIVTVGLGVLVGAGAGVFGMTQETYDRIDVLVAADDAYDSINAAGEGNPLGGRPAQTDLGVVVGISTWTSLVQAGGSWSQANQAAELARQQLEDAQDTLDALRSQLADVGDAYQRAYENAHAQCCDEHFEGVPCAPPGSL